MGPKVPDPLAHVHPQMLRAESETDRKLFVGHLVERSLELLSVTKQDAAFRIGYRDSGVISRWCTGLETPLFHKLVGIDGFREAWILAIGEQNPRAEVEFVVKVKLRVAS